MGSVLWASLPGIVSGVIVGVMLGVWEFQQKRRTADARREAKQRVRSEQVRISLLVAAAKLSYAVAAAIKRGSPNGEIEEGVKAYNAAMREFQDFERALLAEKSADS